MSDASDRVLGMQCDVLGNRSLCGQRFENRCLPELIIGPLKSLDEKLTISGCQFVNCSIEPGAAIVFDGVAVCDVEFHNIHTTDHLLISSFALLENVKVSGAISKGLWVKPLDDLESTLNNPWRTRTIDHLSRIQMALDVSQFTGSYLEVLGIPEDKLAFDRARCFIIDQRWFSVDWDALEIPKTSFWRIRMSRLVDFNVDSGLFLLPDPRNKRFDQIQKDKAKLERAGLLPSC